VTTIEQRQRDAQDARERLDAYLRRSGLGSNLVSLVPLTGDASDRKYFRLVTREGPPLVLALNPQPFTYESLPFVGVATLLEAMPLPVPAIVDHAGDLGVLALQDLGDVTLQAYLGAVSAREHLGLYRRAVSFIETMQRRGADLASPSYSPYHIAFDEEKLLWELEFFTKHFLEGYRGVQIGSSDRAQLRAEWESIAGALASEPRVLCHRDYHSRNLMVCGGDLYIIDFQDARMGPDTYDLVSLLKDSYVDLGDDVIHELMDHFISLKRDAAPNVFGDAWAKAFPGRFGLMALQRNLKALGTFGYQTTARGNPVYIQYIPRTLRYARTQLAHDERFASLRALLGGWVEELS
jgi:aminoglycoside/choline kinase family phosphotransferase